MHWRLKGAIQKVLTYVPRGGELHYFLQRRGGGLRNFAAECDLKVNDWRLMIGQLRAVGATIAGATLLEMGTGWYPTFPLCLYLAGAAHIYTYDLHRHLKPEMTLALAERLADHVPLIAREAGRAEAEVVELQRRVASALRGGMSIAEATRGAIDYVAPADAATTGLGDASIDVAYSNSVLEHVPPPVIEACLLEALRCLRPGGVAFHSVNCGDHYAYVDPSIHQLNYLRYSDAAWGKWNNGFLYQNRLRACDFTDLARRAGFAIEIDTARATPQRIRELESIPVHREFERYTRQQLAPTSIDFIGRKPY